MREMRGNKRKVEGLQELCECLPSGLKGLEIGSFAGESAQIFIESGRFEKLYCVDPWNDGKSKKPDVEVRFDVVAEQHPEIVKCKGYLQDHVHDIPPLDFIYIDAQHKLVQTYQFVFQSLLLAKEPCWLAGHDYDNRQYDGLIEAIDTIFGGHMDNMVFFEDTSYMIKVDRHRGKIETSKP